MVDNCCNSCGFELDDFSIDHPDLRVMIPRDACLNKTCKMFGLVQIPSHIVNERLSSPIVPERLESEVAKHS